MPGDLADDLLELHPGPEEQLERSRDPLLEHAAGPHTAAPRKSGQRTRRTSVMVEKRLSSSVTSRLASPG